MPNNKIIRVILVGNEKEVSLVQSLFDFKSHPEIINQHESSFTDAKLAISTDAFEICIICAPSNTANTLDFVREIKLEKPSIPIILVNQASDPKLESSALLAGATEYIAVSESIPATTLLRMLRFRAHQAHQMEQLRDQQVDIVMQDRLASIGLLASSLAHEIGTPLGVIRGRSEYMALQRKEDSFITKNLDTVISQIDRISHLIKSLLNLAHGTHTETTSGILLHEMIAEVTELLAHELRKHDINLINEYLQMPPMEICAEVTQFHQVLISILVNSIHAIEVMAKKGRTGGHFIKICAKDMGENFCLCIEDNGCGISPKNIQNLFKPFFTTKDIGKGTDLGLTISYRIVESWGGKINVESKENEGAKIFILIPKA